MQLDVIYGTELFHIKARGTNFVETLLTPRVNADVTEVPKLLNSRSVISTLHRLCIHTVIFIIIIKY